MNLIEQIQQTPKWGKFTEWYEKNKHLNIPPLPIFLSYEVMLQKGVFEKFIESQHGILEQDHTGNGYCYSIWDSQEGYDEFKSFEQLLIWYFNN